LDWRWGCFWHFLVAAMPNPAGKHYYFEIMLPGSILGPWSVSPRNDIKASM